MVAALEKRDWDIVISDYSMPQFGATRPWRCCRPGLDVPFISVSGTMGEDVAVAMMKAGAHDYVMKDDLKRLVPAVERELEAAIVRREGRRPRNPGRCWRQSWPRPTTRSSVQRWRNNPELESWRGGDVCHTAQEMISQPVRVDSAGPPNELSGVFEKFKQGENAQRYETVRVRKDGGYVTISLAFLR